MSTRCPTTLVFKTSRTRAASRRRGDPWRMASLGRMPPGRDNRHRSHPANQGHLSKDIALKGSDSFLFCLLTELRGRFQDVTQLSPVPFAGGNIEEDEDLDFVNFVLTQAVQMPLHRPPRCASFSPSQFPKLFCYARAPDSPWRCFSSSPREEEEDDEVL